MNGSIIALGGPPCSGKTETGKELSKLLKADFRDIDQMVEETAGMSVSELFRVYGEGRFRKLEKQSIRQALDISRGGAVLALGGGALLDGETLALVQRRCILFVLTADPKILCARNTGGRPLSPDNDSFVRLLERRKTHYDSLGNRVNTSGMTCREAAVHIAAMVRKADRPL